MNETKLISQAKSITIFPIFYTFLQIKTIKETSLSANQEKSQMKRLNWRAEGDKATGETAPIKGGVLDSSTLIVEFGPMEIRTFLLGFL